MHITCHCGTTGVEQTPNKSQHRKLTLEKKILPPLLPGFELETFRSRFWRSNQQALTAPNCSNIGLQIETKASCASRTRVEKRQQQQQQKTDKILACAVTVCGLFFF